MSLTITGKIRTDLHPDDIRGATLYLIVGKFGDSNLDHAIGLESELMPAYDEVDGVRRRDHLHLAFEEEFELDNAPDASSAMVQLVTTAGIQLAKVPRFEISGGQISEAVA